MGFQSRSRRGAANVLVLLVSLGLLLALVATWVLWPVESEGGAVGSASRLEEGDGGEELVEGERNVTREGAREPTPDSTPTPESDPSTTPRRDSIDTSPPPSSYEHFAWEGRVLGPDGAPVANTRLHLVAESPIGYSDGPRLAVMESRTRTDAEGHFVLEFLDGGRIRSSTYDEEQVGLVVADADWDPTPHPLPRPRKPPRGIVVHAVPSRAVLPVRVVDSATDEPRPGIEIQLRAQGAHAIGTTDTEGRVRLPGPVGIELWLEVVEGAQGSFDQDLPPSVLIAGMNAERVVELRDAPLAVRFRAVDATTRAPIHDAIWELPERAATEKMLFFPFGGAQSVALDASGAELLAEGTAEFHWDSELAHDADGEARLRVHAPEYLPATVTWRDTRLDRPVDVPLDRRAHRAFAFVVTEDGLPLDAGTVHVAMRGLVVQQVWSDSQRAESRWGYAPGPWYRGEAEIETSGMASVRLPWPVGRPLAARIVIAVEPEGEPTTRAIQLWQDDLGAQPWRLEVGDGIGLLEFRVHLAGGGPAAGQTVEVELARSDEKPVLLMRHQEWADGERSDRSDERGRASFRVPAGIPLRWRVAPDEEWTEERALSGGEYRVVNVSSEELGEIAGRLVLTDGSPWEGSPSVSLWLYDVDGEELSQVVARPANAPDGSFNPFSSGGGAPEGKHFRFADLPNGRYRIAIARGPSSDDAPWAEPGDTDVVVTLPPAHRVHFELRDAADGRLVTEAAIVMLLGASGYARTRTGTGEIAFVPSDEEVFIGAHVPGYLFPRVPLGQPPDGSGADIRRMIELTRARVVELRVLGLPPDFEPHDFEFELLVAEGEPKDENTLSDAKTAFVHVPGVLRLDSMPPSAHRLRLKAVETGEVWGTIDVPAAPSGYEADHVTTLDYVWPR